MQESYIKFPSREFTKSSPPHETKYNDGTNSKSLQRFIIDFIEQSNGLEQDHLYGRDGG